MNFIKFVVFIKIYLLLKYGMNLVNKQIKYYEVLFFDEIWLLI